MGNDGLDPDILARTRGLAIHREKLRELVGNDMELVVVAVPFHLENGQPFVDDSVPWRVLAPPGLLPKAILKAQLAIEEWALQAKAEARRREGPPILLG